MKQTDCDLELNFEQCDETKPQCANCKRRGVHCDLTLRTTATSPHPERDDKTSAVDLPMSEIELTYHWTTSTCHSISAWSEGATTWQALMADMGFDHPYVMHLLFALTALHLAFCRPSRKELYTTTADYHYERALALVTPEIASINASNCDAVLISVQTICFISWARGPQPGEYLAFGQNGRSDWLVMFRGIRTTLESLGRDQFVRSHVPALRYKGRPLSVQDAPAAYEKQLDELHGHISAISKDTPESEDNISAVEILRSCYENRYQGIDGEYHIAFAWLFRMKDDFLDRLQQRDPTPLLIYAHFVVLMHDMERFWYMKGWTHHVMGGIFEALAVEHRMWIRWPMAMIGWIAP
ncbi:hypothetical protein P153DRAFT_369782 [Dothidotthia symphoricarpi CBS 119687]|uniref:Zn(2)-C6 fungal-type domain-containing protein n=1 Tax=Dothidotthia symphoricarpi CBS 119687 TaxID=1392245 RepID=A0A6A6A2M0_9PLEO|nr:uncharacterized protein P153DRAFT_369782 [Dothidotthia symphoricarpi CBS 119687]KAF2125786.1 hypothetical protein P153DRAFT_369782 [Dothidotthia symphoricarpi CBS 119687]